MSAIGILAAEADDRRELALLLGELGHAAEAAGGLDEALAAARERTPRAFLVVDGAGADAERLTRELSRAYPLLPVVAALKSRDAGRAVTLMRAGALEVVAPPWSRAELKACVAKSLRGSGTALSPLRAPPRRRSALWYVLALGTFLAAGLGTASLRRAERLRREAAARVDRWALPVSHPSGLAFDGRDLWVIDWFTQSFYQTRRDGAATSSVRHLTAETPVAAAFTADGLWTVVADGTVARRSRDAKLTELQRWPSAAPNCAGVAFDGLYLWFLDARARTLTKRLPDERLSVLSTSRVPDLAPAGLAWDGRSLWTLDAGDRALRRHDLERPGLVVAVLPLPEYADGTHAPKGLAWDGERFWTVAERRDGKGPALLSRHRDEGSP